MGKAWVGRGLISENSCVDFFLAPDLTTNFRASNLASRGRGRRGGILIVPPTPGFPHTNGRETPHTETGDRASPFCTSKQKKVLVAEYKRPHRAFPESPYISELFIFFEKLWKLFQEGNNRMRASFWLVNYIDTHTSSLFIFCWPAHRPLEIDPKRKIVGETTKKVAHEKKKVYSSPPFYLFIFHRQRSRDCWWRCSDRVLVLRFFGDWSRSVCIISQRKRNCSKTFQPTNPIFFCLYKYNSLKKVVALRTLNTWVHTTRRFARG